MTTTAAGRGSSSKKKGVVGCDAEGNGLRKGRDAATWLVRSVTMMRKRNSYRATERKLGRFNHLTIRVLTNDEVFPHITLLRGAKCQLLYRECRKVGVPHEESGNGCCGRPDVTFDEGVVTQQVKSNRGRILSPSHSFCPGGWAIVLARGSVCS